jgi:hypothetical protein
MTYSDIEKRLKVIFNENNFFELVQAGDKNTQQLPIKNDEGINLVINYPSYKSKAPYYDYRVDLNGIAISHTNIITDLYNKSSQHPEIISDLLDFLYKLYAKPYGDYQNYQHIDRLKIFDVSNELKETVNRAHNGKNYPIEGNNHNFSIAELALIITIIVLQEDINYPNGLGRKMSFDRYIESIAINDIDIRTPYSLSDVIQRALLHSKPPYYPELKEEYFAKIEL